MHPRLTALLESAFSIVTGSAGTYVAVIRPWQEQAQWAAQMLLLGFSIVSVILGILVAVRALRK